MIHLTQSCKRPFAHYPYPALLVELRRGAGRSVHARYMLPVLIYAYTRASTRQKNKNILKNLRKMLDNAIYIWYNIIRKKKGRAAANGLQR